MSKCALALSSLLFAACHHGAPAAPTSKPQAAAAPRPDERELAQAPATAKPAKLEDELVAYRLSPRLRGAELVALEVELRFRGGADGTTALVLPEQWAAARTLWKNLHQLTIEGATSDEVPDASAPWRHVLHAPPGAPLVVRYEVRSAYDGPPAASVGQPFEPIICPTWFYAFGRALFATVEREREPPIRFRWEARSPMPFASDLEHLADGAGSEEELLDSIVIGGPEVEVRDRDGLRVAIVSKFRFPNEAFIELAQAILATQRGFFGAAGRSFLIAVSPLVPDGHASIGGSSVGDAFAASLSQSTPLAELRELISHELFHSWNPVQLGRLDEAAELREKWFSEGFTNFYSSRLLQRGALVSPEDFAVSWNRVLLDYESSPVRDQPNQRIEADYWRDPAVSKLPYHRGQMLAALWDHELRRATAGAKDLDDVILAAYAKVQAAGSDRAALPTPAELFVATYKELGGTWIDEELDRYVRRGEHLVLPGDVFGGCAEVKQREQATFARGWDAEATSAADNVVTGLAKDSPAYRAGLREGMKILERTAGQPGDATVRYELRVLDGDKPRTIAFWPKGKGPMKTQRVEVSPKLTAAARAACSERLGGG